METLKLQIGAEAHADVFVVAGLGYWNRELPRMWEDGTDAQLQLQWAFSRVWPSREMDLGTSSGLPSNAAVYGHLSLNPWETSLVSFAQFYMRAAHLPWLSGLVRPMSPLKDVQKPCIPRSVALNA